MNIAIKLKLTYSVLSTSWLWSTIVLCCFIWSYIALYYTNISLHRYKNEREEIKSASTFVVYLNLCLVAAATIIAASHYINQALNINSPQSHVQELKRLIGFSFVSFMHHSGLNLNAFTHRSYNTTKLDVFDGHSRLRVYAMHVWSIVCIEKQVSGID